MNAESEIDSDYLKQILVGANLSGVYFGHELSIKFSRGTFSFNGKPATGPIHLTLCESWTIMDSDEKAIPQMPPIRVEDQLSLLFSVSEQDVVNAEIIKPQNHLRLYMERGKSILVNGFSSYEPWIVGFSAPGLSVQLIAQPGSSGVSIMENSRP